MHSNDKQCKWACFTYIGQNLFLVAVAEFGHALELCCSHVHSSVMQLILSKGYRPNVMLHDSDILELQVNIVLHLLATEEEVLLIHSRSSLRVKVLPPVVCR